MILGEQAGKINAAYGRIQANETRNGDLTFWDVHAKESESLAELGGRYRDVGNEERMGIEVDLEGQVLHPLAGEKECVICEEVFVGVEFGGGGSNGCIRRACCGWGKPAGRPGTNGRVIHIIARLNRCEKVAGGGCGWPARLWSGSRQVDIE